MTPQEKGLTNDPCMRIVIEATAARAAKTRMWPTCAQQRRSNQGAEHIADVVAGHDGAGHHRGKPFESRAQTEKRALQAGAQHERPHAEEQRPGRVKRHGVSETLVDGL